MSELADRTPLEHYGEIFVTQDLRMCLESEMLKALDEAVDRGWFTPEQAATEFAVWCMQFE